jgi:hypothetical protein
VKEGRLDELKKSFDENIPVLERDKPGTFMFYASFQIFGNASEEALGMLRQIADTGVEVTIVPAAAGGFIRLPG